MALTRRIAEGSYVTADGYRIERIEPELRGGPYGDGWHLLRGYGQDAYLGTYATKREALANIPVATLALHCASMDIGRRDRPETESTMSATHDTITAAAQQCETAAIALNKPVLRLTESYVENGVRKYIFTTNHHSAVYLTAQAALALVTRTQTDLLWAAMYDLDQTTSKLNQHQGALLAKYGVGA